MPIMPVCVTCQKEYRPEKNGITAIEMASFGPYKIWAADLLKCPKCGHLVISGYSDFALDHLDSNFKAALSFSMESGNAYLFFE